MPRSGSERMRSSLFSRSRPGSLSAAAIGPEARKGLATSVSARRTRRHRSRPRGGGERQGRSSGRGTGRSYQLLELQEDHTGEADLRLLREIGPAVQVLDLAAARLQAPGDRLAVHGGAELAQVLDAELPFGGALEARMLAGDVGQGVEPEVDPDVRGLAADDDLVLGHQIGLGSPLVLIAQAGVGRERVGELP